MPVLRVVKPSSPAEKRTRSVPDTIEITPKLAAAWKKPPFQRDLTINAKCEALIEEYRVGGVVPGTITLGVLDGETYLVDGQHRVGMFLASDVAITYGDVRTIFCADMSEMAREYVNLNQRLVSLRPDDILRGLESCYAPLRWVREKCQFVGYGKKGKGDKAPIVSMSLVLRAWRASTVEVPAGSSAAATLGATLTQEEAEQLVSFLSLCFEAWGRHNEYGRLWSALNMTLCAWLYRRLVIVQYSPKTPRLTRDLFRKCLMSLSADSNYLDWLTGRTLGEHNRSPGYDRIKRCFADRLAIEMGKKPSMPAPAWANG